MKKLALLPLLFIVSCASHPQSKVGFKPLPQPVFEPAEALRYPDTLRAYYVGRFADPNHPELLNEQHAVYRVEASSRWNLHAAPSGVRIATPLNPPADPAFSPPPASDALVAEMNRQRDATAQIMAEAVQLGAAYNDLQKLVNEMRNVARNNIEMKDRLAGAEQRLADLQKQLQKLAPDSPSATNDPASDFGSSGLLKP